MPPCLVGLEACGGSHYWVRQIAALGHDVAVTRKIMRFVPIKSADQQAAAMVLKTRALLVRQQTQAISALRAHLSELGVIAATGPAKVEALIEIVRDETDARLPKAARFALTEIAHQIETLG